ncbi:MAG TPA: TRAP transporter large permease subunit [Campylobacteraceae bacterium]|nr:TRAP transporter large permease subunit [Campylobacteraceae bacterium]
MIGLWMFAGALLLLMIGFPVAFAFGAAAMVTACLTPDAGLEIFALLPYRIWGIMQNFTLIAVPLFIFMGLILEKSKIAESLLVNVGKLFGNMRGGLAISTVLVGTVLAASTGIVGASVVMMSIISLPIMIRHGYSRSLSAGTIAASGTLGQIIPPSIVLIILGDVMSISVGDLFKAAVGPSLLLVALYILYIVILTWRRPELAPPILSDAPRKTVVLRALRAIFAPALLILLVLGSIFMGVATPTESAAFGSVGAILLTVANRVFSLRDLYHSALETVKLTAMIFMILIGATAFSLTFNEVGGSDLVLQFFAEDIADGWLFIGIAMASIFLLGFFVDFLEICFIVIPILVPIVTAFGIDPLWFAILVAMNLQASFLTPPFGFALFYLKGASGDLVTTGDIYRGVIPYIALQLLALVILINFPELVRLFV